MKIPIYKVCGRTNDPLKVPTIYHERRRHPVNKSSCGYQMYKLTEEPQRQKETFCPRFIRLCMQITERFVFVFSVEGKELCLHSITAASSIPFLGYSQSKQCNRHSPFPHPILPGWQYK